MKSILIPFIVVTLSFPLLHGFAQQEEDTYMMETTTEEQEDARPQTFGIGLGLGFHFMNSDVQDNSTFFRNVTSPAKIGGKLLLEYSFLRLGKVGKLMLLGSLGIHPVGADADPIQNYPESKYAVTNSLMNFSAALQVELFPKSRLRPFGFIGMGMMIYEPKVTTSTTNENRFQKYINVDKTSSGSVPLGGGLKYSASDNLDLFGSFYKFYTFVDNLDGWESEINDNVAVISLGAMYYFGDKYKEEIEITPTPVTPPPAPVAKDTDGDGLLDEDETTIYKTDPNNPDTDGDGLKDGDEVKVYKTDPLNPDTDGDRLRDGDEVNRYKTDPLKKDTDGDGCIDGDEVIDMKTDPLRTDTDGDGLTDCDERNVYRTNPLVMDTDDDGTNDGTEVRNGTDPLRADVLRLEEGKKIALEGINFRTNRADILPESEEILMKAYNTMRTNPDIRVEIAGHTDDVGKDQANMTLSDRRANAVRQWLIDKGIAANRIVAKGYGETQHIVPNDSDENRAKNRRIEFSVIK